jgi:hypothetical protein
MASGLTSYTQISSLVQSIQEGALATLNDRAVLAQTVTVLRGSGVAPRKGYEWTDMTVKSLAETDDIAPDQFDKSLLATLTPARWGMNILMTDARVNSDWEDTRRAAATEMGAKHAAKVTAQIASHFSSLTGGTVGSALGTLSWSNIHAAVAKLMQADVVGPYYCVLGAGQAYHLLNAINVSNAAFQNSAATADMAARGLFTLPMFSDVKFAVSSQITGAAGGTAYGAMYAQAALAFDERVAFNVAAQRDESRRAWELTSDQWYATGTWAAARGITLLGTDVIA